MTLAEEDGGMDAGSTGGRAGQLDAIRAFCVVAVTISHTITENIRIGGLEMFELGAYGVYMFFILSGFLITGQLLVTREKKEAAGDPAWRPLALFYAKRALRLFPAYYLALAVAGALNMPGILVEMKWHLLQLSDILFAISPWYENASVAGHYWTLTLEWQFYAVWPIASLCLPRKALFPLIGAAILVAAWSWSPLRVLPAILERTNILQSLDSLGFGAALALAQHRRMSLAWFIRAAWPAAAVCAAGLTLAILGYTALYDKTAFLTHEAMNWTFAAIMLTAVRGYRGPIGAVLNNPAMQYVGRISYGIYVYHYFLLYWYVDYLKTRGLPPLEWDLWLSLRLFVVSTAVAALSWHAMEAPIQRLRRYLAYRRPDRDDRYGLVAPAKAIA
jgi:peptidoglycan/LPS O-acetylase OafA/YrhL